MRDPHRIETIMEQIQFLWSKPENKDMRLMQLLLNALPTTHCRHTLYNLEDWELEQALTNFYENK
jgi:hypothetical protein